MTPMWWINKVTLMNKSETLEAAACRGVYQCQDVAVRCSILQCITCVAVCCSVVQCVSVYYSAWRCVSSLTLSHCIFAHTTPHSYTHTVNSTHVTNTHKHTHTHINSWITRTSKFHAHTHIHMYTWSHTHTHTYIHTHIHTHPCVEPIDMVASWTWCLYV